MEPSRPFAELPDEVQFTLEEVADLLFAVDLAVEKTTLRSPEHEVARRAQRLITSRQWPELGDLLGDDDDEEQ